jgi:hypothetical protein
MALCSGDEIWVERRESFEEARKRVASESCWSRKPAALHSTGFLVIVCCVVAIAPEGTLRCPVSMARRVATGSERDRIGPVKKSQSLIEHAMATVTQQLILRERWRLPSTRQPRAMPIQENA